MGQVSWLADRRTICRLPRSGDPVACGISASRLQLRGQYRIRIGRKPFPHRFPFEFSIKRNPISDASFFQIGSGCKPQFDFGRESKRVEDGGGRILPRI